MRIKLAVKDPKYSYRESGQWKLRVLEETWSSALWRRVLGVIRSQLPSKHPQTVALRFPEAKGGPCFFLKVYYPECGIAAWKNLVRESKAFRFLRQGLELSKAGFQVPWVVAAGEERYHRLLKCAFVLTLEIHGEVLPIFLQRSVVERSGRINLAEKRKAVDRLARQIRRFHELGFVHGDLVPSNIMVVRVGETGQAFYLMDHDRTRRYPTWLPQTVWKRNLVQLNRFPLAGISLQDRMRFFRTYSGRRDWSRSHKALLRWLERKTRKRRKECDAADLDVSFRRLMRWDRRVVDNG